MNSEIILGIAILIGLLIYLWYKIIRPRKKVKKQKQSRKIKEKFTNTYEFYKNYFKVENPEGKAQILYFKIYRAVETNTDFYIYISREYAFIVSKKGFTKGEYLQFAEFLKKKLFYKYKNRMKDSSAK